MSSTFRNLLSIPISERAQSIPFDSCPLITPAFIDFSGSSAPGRATITLSPFLTFGAPHTICVVLLPIFTWQTCKWSESGCILHSNTSPITRFVAFINFVAESYSFPAFVMSSANVFKSTSMST